MLFVNLALFIRKLYEGYIRMHIKLKDYCLDCKIFFLNFLYFGAPFYGLWYVDNTFSFWNGLCLTFVFMFWKMVLKKYQGVYLILYFLISYLPMFFVVGHQILFKTPLNSASIFSILGTNFGEILSFCFSFMNWPIIIVFIGSISLLTLLWRDKHISFQYIKNFFIWISFFCFLFLLLQMNNLLPFAYLIENYKQYNKIINDMVAVNTSTESYQTIIGINKEPQTYVIVIGESVSRNEMSVYGYLKETTPFLSKEEDLFVFQNVISPHAVTMNSLQKALTLANENDMSLAWSKGSLIQFMKDAGYKTYWISNQEEFGLFANLVTVLAKQADVYSFPKKEQYDESLIPLFKQALSDKAPRKVIFLHLKGSHYEYKDRYPSDADYFNAYSLKGSEALRAHYDNSIRYTDCVLEKLLNLLKQEKNAMAFLYFSDHGEDVSSENSCFCHEEAMSTPDMYAIPFIMWLSPKYREMFPHKVVEIESQLQSKFNLQYFMETMVDLVGLSHPDIDTSQSLFVKKEASLPPIKKAFQPNFFPDKIWLHMVNSSDRLSAYWDTWNGFETDIFWNSEDKTFHVSHDTPYAKETLEDLWRERLDLEKKYFWLDFKNMSLAEMDDAVKEMNRLTEKYGVPRTHIIIEGKNGVVLTNFTKSGYWTSLYLSCYRWTNPVTKKTNIQKDYATLSSSQIHFVSADANYFQDVMLSFPNYPKLFWNMAPQQQRFNQILLKHSDEIAVILNQDKRYFYKPGKVFWN